MNSSYKRILRSTTKNLTENFTLENKEHVIIPENPKKRRIKMIKRIQPEYENESQLQNKTSLKVIYDYNITILIAPASGNIFTGFNQVYFKKRFCILLWLPIIISSYLFPFASIIFLLSKIFYSSQQVRS